MTDTEMFMVCTICATFNHESFIGDAMRGFVLQKTSFPVVSVIIDDASTDDTASVINRFLNEQFDFTEEDVAYRRETDFGKVAFARHRENTNCFFAVLFLKENHFSQKKSKYTYYEEWIQLSHYVAICEGDDFWTNPLKLQKQVDFMDAHEEYSMCFHKVSVLTEVEWEKAFFNHLHEGEYTARQIYDKWTVPTCSVVYRRRFGPFESNPSIVYGDIYMWLQLAEKGKLYCLDFCGGVYRRHQGGFSVLNDYKMYPLLADQYRYMGRRFPQLRDISKRNEDTNLRIVVKMPYFKGIFKYRIRYMYLHPKLFFSYFMTTTLLSYTPLRHH